MFFLQFNKEVKDGRWRAFSKGCIEVCERHSEFTARARSSLNEAPKDVKRLEILKPPSEKNMKERYDASIAKEKRLQSAVQPRISKKALAAAEEQSKKMRQEQQEAYKAEMAKSEDEEQENKKKKKKKKKTKALPEANKFDLENVSSLQEEDKVKEGVDWSDDEDAE